jgi:hypothetical protein
MRSDYVKGQANKAICKPFVRGDNIVSWVIKRFYWKIFLVYDRNAVGLRNPLMRV